MSVGAFKAKYVDMLQLIGHRKKSFPNLLSAVLFVIKLHLALVTCNTEVMCLARVFSYSLFTIIV